MIVRLILDMNVDKAIYDTIRYFALFDMPVTAVEIWRCLLVESDKQQPLPKVRLADIQHVLAHSTFLQERIASQWGYYFLADQAGSVERRLQRRVLAQHKWMIAKRAARLLAFTPFVRALFGSGSLALHNTRPESDLDFFIIAKAGRIWTARLGLLIASQILGRRRTHWEPQAPDKVCLNHYITDDHLLMPQPVRNMFTAVAYTRFIPVFNHGSLVDFQWANRGWMHAYVVSPPAPALRHRYEVVLPKIAGVIKDEIEKLLLEPIGNWIERQARRLQLAAIHRHTYLGRAGRIVAEDTELAFHPDSRVPALLQKFQAP
jgi:hypothetical protein